MALFDTTAFRILEQGLSVMWQRQQVINENLVNENTPDYNQKTLDFGGILKDKIRADGSVKKELNLAQALYIDRYTNDQADHNNVDHDAQMAELARTGYWIDAIINSMNGNLSRVKSAMVTK